MRNYVIALYIRLSVEDFKTESLSIPNQKLILREKAMSLPVSYTHLKRQVLYHVISPAYRGRCGIEFCRLH